MVQRYVDILTNSGFKAFFGDANNREAVMSVLNVLLPERRKIKSMEILATEHSGPIVDVSKEYRYDFMCKDADGVSFIVELQKYRDENWFKRCVSYASRAYDRQNRRGQGYDVPPVYLIGLMTVDLDHPDKDFWRDRYISEYTFREKESHDLLAETIVIIFAELANFTKTEQECLTETDQMLFVLKNIGRLMQQPPWLQKEVFDRIFRGCEIAQFDERKRIIYEQEMYDEDRRLSELRTATKDGFAEGKKEGMKEGMKEGIKEGIKEGKKEGKKEGIKEGKVESARNLKALGVSDEIIAQATGLPLEVVKSL